MSTVMAAMSATDSGHGLAHGPARLVSSFLCFKAIFGAVAQGVEQGGAEVFVSGPLADERFEVKHAVVVEAGFEHTHRRESDAVAGAAKEARVSGDNADTPFEAGYLVVERGAARRVFQFYHLGKPGLDVSQYLRVGPGFGLVFPATSVEWHFLDKANTDGQLPGQFDHGKDVVGIAAVHYHTIDFDGQVVVEQFVESSHDPGKRVATGDLRKAFRVKTVEAEIDRGQAHGFEPRHKAGGEGSVGGDVEFFQALNFQQPFEKIHHAFAQERLATGDAHFVNAHAHHQPDDALHLLVTQQLPAWQIFNALLRHTIEAPQIATVGNGQSQVSDGASVVVV